MGNLGKTYAYRRKQSSSKRHVTEKNSTAPNNIHGLVLEKNIHGLVTQMHDAVF
jgi:hypothetical protein